MLVFYSYVSVRAWSVPHQSCFLVPLKEGQVGLEPAVHSCCLPAVKLCHGQAAVHLQEMLHAGLWAGPAVHQHHGGRPACEYRYARPPTPWSVL